MPRARWFGPYPLLHKIAQAVWVRLWPQRGRQGFSRHVVVKRMLSHLADRADLEMSLPRRVASRLHHDRIVQVHDAGRIGDEFYLEMEFVSGVDLKVLLQRCEAHRRPFPIARSSLRKREGLPMRTEPPITAVSRSIWFIRHHPPTCSSRGRAR